MRSILSRPVRPSALFLVGSLLAACATPEKQLAPGETAGTIYVGSPRVSGRERLVNERRAQDEWLDRQMANVDQAEFGINGGLDTRSFAGLMAGLQAKTGPDVDLFRAQQINNLALVREQAQTQASAEKIRSAAFNEILTKLTNKTIDAKEAQAQLAAYGFSYGALSSTVGAASAPSASGAGGGVLAAFGGAPSPSRVPGSGATGNLAKVSTAPIDHFEDLLALRNRIDSEKAQNGLDETHDLYGNTLYRLTFDATVLPDNDTSAWGVVEVELIPPIAADDPKVSLWEKYRRYKERAMQDQLIDMASLITKHSEGACKTERPYQAIPCAADKAFSQELALQVRGEYGNRVRPSRSESAFLTPSKPRDLFASQVQDIKALLRSGKSSAERNYPPINTANEGLIVWTVVASVLEKQFKEEGLHCFFRLTTRDGGDFPSESDAANQVIRLAEPASSASLDSDCKSIAVGYTQGQHAQTFFNKANGQPRTRVYAVTPKETVQQISDVSSRRTATELVFGLSALAGAGAIDAMVKSARENEAFVQALRRQPLVVGFTRRGAEEDEPAEQASTTSKSPPAKDSPGVAPAAASAPASAPSQPAQARRKPIVVGWVLGPTYTVDRSNGRERAAFRHTVRQQALTADVSVPSWWPSMNVRVTTRWVRESEALRQVWPAGASAGEATYVVNLPNRMSSLDGMLNRTVLDRTPVVDLKYAARVQVGEPARLLIEGRNLWRSAEVFIGAQRADRVRLLPNMQGLVAEFDEVRPLWGANSSDVVPITVATSEGTASVGEAAVIRNAAATPSVVGFGRRFIVDQQVALSLEPPVRAFRLVEIRAKSRDDAAMNVKLADTESAGGLVISRDGGTARTTALKTADIKIDPGQVVDLFLVVVSDASVAPETVMIQKNAVYYPTLDASKGDVAWGPGTGLRPVVLTLPNGVRSAYQSAAGGTLTLSATLTTVTGEAIDLTPATCKIEPKDSKTPHLVKQCTLKLDRSQKSADLVNAIKSGEFELSLRLDGDDAPPLKTTTLKGK